jgi:hypothetical protein
MPITLKNLSFFKNLNDWTPEAGQKLTELIQEMAQGVNNIEQQTNSNANGTPQAPPAINSLNVTGSNGHFQVAINHEGAEFYRGVQYFVEHSASPHFIDPHIVPLGTSRNANIFLGNATRYFRAYASYGASPPGPAVYHGTLSQPKAVVGGGTVPGPSFVNSQGSGTGTPGQGLSGPGLVPYRTKDGAPPARAVPVGFAPTTELFKGRIPR